MNCQVRMHLVSQSHPESASADFEPAKLHNHECNFFGPSMGQQAQLRLQSVYTHYPVAI